MAGSVQNGRAVAAVGAIRTVQRRTSRMPGCNVVLLTTSPCRRICWTLSTFESNGAPAVLGATAPMTLNQLTFDRRAPTSFGDSLEPTLRAAAIVDHHGIAWTSVGRVGFMPLHNHRVRVRRASTATRGLTASCRSPAAVRRCGPPSHDAPSPSRSRREVRRTRRSRRSAQGSFWAS